jgi:ankyrin repeat protein
MKNHIKLFEEYTGSLKERKRLNSLLFKEVRKNDPSADEVRRLIDIGADPNSREPASARYDVQATPLMLVAYNWKSPEVAKILVDRGADLDAKSINGDSALAYAVRGGNAEAVRFLIDAGADVNTRDFDGRSLFPSSKKAEITRILIDAGLDPKDSSSNGVTPLHSAAVSSPPDLLKVLIDAGADVNAVDGHGDTPLAVTKSLASAHPESGRIRAKLLILSGADPTTAFDDLDDFLDFFNGDVSWMPDEFLPDEWKRARRSRGAFGRF